MQGSHSTKTQVESNTQYSFNIEKLYIVLFFAFELLFFGSSRKVVGFKPSKRQSKIANEGKEILIVSIAVADTLSHLDFVVEALQFACADRENSMGSKAVQT